MVKPRPNLDSRMAATLVLVTLALATSLATAQDAPAPNPPQAQGDPIERTRDALKSGDYPWYDPPRDAIRPVILPRENVSHAPPSRGGGGGGWSWGNWSWGERLVFLLFAAAIAALGFLVYRSWKRFEPPADAETAPEHATPAIGAGEVLPAALRPVAVGGDLWAEADRRRQAGDLAGAIICLFAHQLLSLSRLGLVRLVPGRTGRQLQRSVADRDFQALVLTTLRQFEAVYYGHRSPTAADFAAVWAAAETFERRAAEQGKR